MAEKQKTGKEIVTSHDQLIGFIELCNEAMTKKIIVKEREGVLNALTKKINAKEKVKINEIFTVKNAENNLKGVDVDLVSAIKFIYGYPDISYIEIEKLDQNKDEDFSTIMKLKEALREDKLKKAIDLVKEAMSKEDFPGDPSYAKEGIKNAEQTMDALKLVWEKYLAGKDVQKNNEQLQYLENNLLKLKESKANLLEQVGRYDRQIAKIQTQLKEGEVINLAEKRAKKMPAEAVPFVGEAKVYDFEPGMKEFIDGLRGDETKQAIMNLIQSAIEQLPEDKLMTFIGTLKELIENQSPVPPNTPPPIAMALDFPEERQMAA